MEGRLEDAVGVIGRVAGLVAREEQTQEPAEIAARARRLLAIEAPLAGPGLVTEVVDRVIGLGPIQPLLEDPEVSDILVNGPDSVWVDRGGALQQTGIAFASVTELMAIVEKAISGLGLRLDRASPMVDGRLADGSRIHVAIPPATVDYPVVAIRRFHPTVRSMGQLVGSGSMTPPQSRLLQDSVRSRRNIIVSGGTGSGKTTLLNVLASCVPDLERMVTVEDAAELDFPGHVVRLEARPPNAEGFGEVTIRDLLRSALRLRPDRIFLGEVRGPEALDLLTALNTGHSGSMSTIHANSPEEALWRLETLALLDGAASADAVRRQLFAAIDLVVQLARDGSRRFIAAIWEVGPKGDMEPVDV